MRSLERLFTNFILSIYKISIPRWTRVIQLLLFSLQRKFEQNKSRNLSQSLKNKNRNLSQILTNLHLYSKSSNQESNFTKKKRIKNWPKLYNRTNYTSICKLSYMRSFIQLFSLILAKRPRNVFFLILFLFDSILSFELFDYINWNLIYMPKFQTRNTFLEFFFFWQFSYDKCINHFLIFFLIFYFILWKV